ncbi:hypothetical protein GCM10027034_03890 [Ramlibacter solisilvae]
MPLEGTYWKLASLRNQMVLPAGTPREPHILFEATDQRFAGFGGCNSLFGSYAREGAQLRLGPVAATRMACASGMELEKAFATALHVAASWRIEGDRLLLLDQGKGVVAEFVSGSQLYACDGGKNLLVHYEGTDPRQQQAWLSYEGRNYRLQVKPVAAGARYVADPGRAAGTRLEWWPQGQAGTLREGQSGKPDSSDDLRTLASCVRKYYPWRTI